MGFSSSMKEKMMVDAARHCCVCHRYKGVKIEVHHIVQEADGGTNTPDNAIPLCFDCHADAGHYNPHHPRGTKFSPQELKLAKKAWLEIVANNRIEPVVDVSDLHCRYYICKNFEMLREIAASDFTRFPVTRPLVAKNHILEALQDIVARHPTSGRSGRYRGRQFHSRNDYLQHYPDVELLSHSDLAYPYFNEVRKVRAGELEEFRIKDGVVDAMLEHDMPISDGVAVVGCYEAACAGVELLEEYLLRDVWCTFLAIRNLSDKPVVLTKLTARILSESGFRDFEPGLGINGIVDLPLTSICPGESVIVPLAVILPPIHPYRAETLSFKVMPETGEYNQVITHTAMDEESVEGFLLYGGAILPESVGGDGASGQFEQMVHQFDLTNFYTIDRNWACGSCPHLFFDIDGLCYARELLAHCEDKTGSDGIIVPEGAKKLIVAELEDEVTYIDSLSVNGVEIMAGVCLHKYDTLELVVMGGEEIEFVGRYVPDTLPRHEVPMGGMRNRLIYDFLSARPEA